MWPRQPRFESWSRHIKLDIYFVNPYLCRLHDINRNMHGHYSVILFCLAGCFIFAHFKWICTWHVKRNSGFITPLSIVKAYLFNLKTLNLCCRNSYVILSDTISKINTKMMVSSFIMSSNRKNSYLPKCVSINTVFKIGPTYSMGFQYHISMVSMNNADTKYCVGIIFFMSILSNRYA